jgi:tRNA(Arg) A34 adenosine deaminase TadA
MSSQDHELRIKNPDWVEAVGEWQRPYTADDDKMRFAILLARENVLRGAGGPFGAAVFEVGTGRLVAAGVNSVVRLSNSVLHAEIMALMMAQQRLQSFTLGAPGLPRHELVTSCEPCAMCLGATVWSGVKRLVCGAARADASKLGFDEGPVFPDSYRYLQDRKIEIVRGVLAEQASDVLRLYWSRDGKVYNG